MLTPLDKLLDIPKGHITPTGWEYLFYSPLNKLLYGDVITVGYGHDPSKITTSLASAEGGFVVKGYAGYSMGHLMKVMSDKKNAIGAIAFWRKVKDPRKFAREYVPSEWARPVPLP